MVSVRLLFFLETFRCYVYILFNNLLLRSQLSHCRDCRGSSNRCLAFTVPVKGLWLTVVETQTFPWRDFTPVTAGKGKLLTLALCLCPGNKPVLVQTAVPGAIPGLSPFLELLVRCLLHPGEQPMQGAQRLPVWFSKLCWIGKVTQKQKFCANCL